MHVCVWEGELTLLRLYDGKEPEIWKYLENPDRKDPVLIWTQCVSNSGT